MSNCSINKEILNDVIKADLAKDEVENLLQTEQVNDTTRKIVALLQEEYKIGDVVNMDFIDEKFIKQYGKDSERELLAAKISGIIEAYPAFSGEIYQFIREIAGESGVKIGITYKGKKAMNINALSIENLNTIYNFALQPKYWENKKNIWGKDTIAYFDGYFARKMTPRRRALREPSGGFSQMARMTEKYVEDVAKRINKFTSEFVNDESTGMNQVVYEILKIGNNVDIADGKDKMMGLFSRYMNGWIYLDKNNEFMIYKDYLKEYDEENNPTGEYKWYNPVKLEDYTPPNKKKGFFHIKLSEGQLNEFLGLAKEAKKITDKLFKYMKDEMSISTEGLLDTLVEAFEGRVDVERLRMIFFKGKTKIETLTGTEIDLLGDFSNKDLELYNQLKDVFSYSINDDFVIANGGKGFTMDALSDDILYKQRYWPILYNQSRFPDILNKAIVKAEVKVAELTAIITEGKLSNGEEVSDDKIKVASKILKDQLSKLEHLKIVRKRVFGLKVDNANNSQLLTGYVADNKYFKSVSNAFDVRQMRVDESVFYDYVKSSMTSIQKNILAAQLVKSIVISRKKNSPEMHEAVSNASINLYKVIFNDPTVEGAFSRGPLKHVLGTTERLNDALNFIRPFRNKTPEQTQNTLNNIKGAITGLHLSGLGTTIQNWLDVFRNIQDSGFDNYSKTVKLMKNKNTKNKIEKIIELSGILDFSDFFSQAMVSGISGLQLEEQVSAAIIKEMVDYHYKINQGIKASKARQEFEDNIRGYLEQSTAFTTAEEFVILDKDLTEAAKYNNRQRRITTRVNRLVQHAIRHEYVIAPILKDKSARKQWAKTLYQKPLQWGGKGLEVWNNFLVTSEFTMDETEKHIRTVSFIIGAQMAQDTGMLHAEIDWFDLDLNREKTVVTYVEGKRKITKRPLNDKERLLEIQDLNTIIQFGRERNIKTNFALSTQGAGQAFYGEIGKLWGTFKNWSSQKFGSDVRKFINAHYSYRNRKKGYRTMLNKPSLKMLKAVLTSPLNTKKLRQKNAAAASFVDFIRIQGTTTLIMDIATISSGPAGWGIRSFMFAFGGKELRGFTSDLLSLFILPTLIMAQMVLHPDDEDNEDWDRWMQYFLRKLPNLGYTASWGQESMWAIINSIREEEKKAKQNIVNFARPFIGGGTIIGDAVTNTATLIEDLLSDD